MRSVKQRLAASKFAARHGASPLVDEGNPLGNERAFGGSTKSTGGYKGYQSRPNPFARKMSGRGGRGR